MHKEKKRILIFIDWFLPGYKAGGPVRSMANMIEQFSEEYHFLVVTRNTDYMETKPYELTADQWVEGPFDSEVYYFSKEGLSFKNMKRLIAETNFDVAYVNGIYSWRFSILPLFFLKRNKIIVGVRGMLARSAINVKSTKKKVFLNLAKVFGLYKSVVFHATNEQEKRDTRAVFGEVPVAVAPNLPRKVLPAPKEISKEKGTLRLVSMARIAPEKNTLFALEALKKYTGGGEIVYDLYGQIYNETYWRDCKAVIDTLPANIHVEYHGLVESDKVAEVIGDYHFLFLPSRGENFGHVILESFTACRPVLISDQTPWRELEKENCGYDLPLEESLFADKIGKMAELDEDEWRKRCNAAGEKAQVFCNDERNLEAYVRLLGE
ncbi:glycosyltransferase family 4 protein [Marinilabilia salmonicolor]|uniref:glycosyltransferase family 4 protein n=1 Tax=Marinilabilia salmonicolor TaxID=989 RepID=UPI00029ABE4C|nr:glycosyltransferase [Marinilabilia salmonicolor]